MNFVLMGLKNYLLTQILHRASLLDLENLILDGMDKGLPYKDSFGWHDNNHYSSSVR